jgi:hypothetical protein
MPKSTLPIVTITALSVGLLFVATDMAAAQKAKRLSYEQAWAECKKQVDAIFTTDASQSAQRYTRGAACMKQHGYRLKRSSLK